MFFIKQTIKFYSRNVEITVVQNKFEKTWNLKELSEDRKLIVNLVGKNLKKGINEFTVIVKYEDGNGRSYGTKATFFVNLTNVTIIQSVLLVFNQFVLFVENLL